MITKEINIKYECDFCGRIVFCKNGEYISHDSEDSYKGTPVSSWKELSIDFPIGRGFTWLSEGLVCQDCIEKFEKMYQLSRGKRTNFVEFVNLISNFYNKIKKEKKV